MKITLISFLFIFQSLLLFSQQTPQNYISPFLDANTNARIEGFGEVGVVTSPFYKNTGLYQNPALISNYSRNAGVDLMYVPWLKELTNDLNIFGFAGYYAIDSSNAFAFNFSRYDYGDLILTGSAGEYLGEENPYELYLKFGYNHSFHKSISLGFALKYYRSDIASPNYYINTKVVNTIAFDLGFSYKKKYNLKKYSYLNTNAGIAITNIGPKVSYSDNHDSFIPTKLSLGVFINPDIKMNKLMRLNIELAYQAEKYLTPTNSNSDMSSFNALYESFYDAPGGLSEEIDEIRHKFGSEFRLSFQDIAYFAFRHGRSIESEIKGNRNYQTFGYGVGLFGFTIDYARITSDDYLPLDKTWFVTLGFSINFDQEIFRF